MEITGRVLEVQEAVTGKSSRGEWKKQNMIIETQDQFPKKVCICNWNDKVDINSVQTGSMVTASINIESREYNGNWYTDVKVWKLQAEGNNPEPSQTDLPGFPPPPLPQDEPSEPDQDLPF